MTDDSADAGPVRLDVLAALVAFDAAASTAADSWVHADGQPYSDAEASLIGSASLAEWELAEALRGGPGQASDPGAPTIAALLRLASGTALEVLLCTGLRQVLLPDGSVPERSRRERTAAFADAYKRLALPGLSGDDLDKAAVLLDRL